MAASTTSAPTAAGPATAIRTSSTDHAIGWSTVTAAATRVRPIMIARKVRLPPDVSPAGTETAM